LNLKEIDAFVKIVSQGRRKDKKFKSLEVREASSSHENFEKSMCIFQLKEIKRN